MFRTTYAQVALTYYRRLFSPFWVGLMVLFALGMIFLSIIESPRVYQRLWNYSLYFFFFQCFTILFALVPIHIKEQFADSRAHLLPGFRKTHIVVAGVVSFIVAVLLPVAASLCLRLHSIGLVAVMACWFSLICCNVLFQKTWQMWIVLAGFFAGLFWGGEFLEEWCSGKYELQAIGLLALGLAIIVGCGVRLCRLNEDMPEYHRRFYKTAFSGKSQNWPGMQYSPGGLRDRLWASHMTGLTRHVQRSPDSLWSRICRWQIGMQTGWAVLWMAGVFSLMMFVPYILAMSTAQHPNTQQPQFPLAMMVMMGTVMSAATTWGILWQRRTRSMQYEFLLPVGRAAYLKQVGLAAALNQLQMWIGLAAVVVLCQQILAPQSTALTAIVLLYSALCQIGLFGLGIWFLRLRNPILVFSVGMVLIQLLMTPMVLAVRPFNNSASSWLHIVLWGSVGFAAFGLLAVWDGYRRWLVADFA